MENRTRELAESVSERGFSVGNDLIFLPDFEASWNENFCNKVYTLKERAYCNSFGEPTLRYASTWAAKEAVYKAVKQLEPSVGAGWKNIEISRKKIAGEPMVTLHKAPDKFDISLTLSHDGDYVWAVAFVKRKEC